jgi:hypothetical protein
MGSKKHLGRFSKSGAHSRVHFQATLTYATWLYLINGFQKFQAFKYMATPLAEMKFIMISVEEWIYTKKNLGIQFKNFL